MNNFIKTGAALMAAGSIAGSLSGCGETSRNATFGVVCENPADRAYFTDKAPVSMTNMAIVFKCQDSKGRGTPIRELDLVESNDPAYQDKLASYDPGFYSGKLLVKYKPNSALVANDERFVIKKGFHGKILSLVLRGVDHDVATSPELPYLLLPRDSTDK